MPSHPHIEEVHMKYLILGFILFACNGSNDNDARGSGDRGSSRDDDNSGSGNNGGSNNGSDNNGSGSNSCYDYGWTDCEDYYDPEPSAWDCTSSSDEDQYWDGYCDCEYYYKDVYWCGY
jgi:hypothetical protein